MLSEAPSTLEPSANSWASETAEGADLVKLGGLVLTRHVGQSIMIGEEVEVQVVEIRTGSVRLKFLAPRSVAVHRREVFDAIRSRPRVAPAEAPKEGRPGGGLVLSRSTFQSVMIGEDVELAITEVRPSLVKIKIRAPRTVPVHRREVFEAIRDDRA